MENLRTAGEKLGKYELEKRHAIELEDYERARHKKSQIDEFRVATYQEMCVEQLLEVHGVSDASSIIETKYNNQKFSAFAKK